MNKINNKKIVFLSGMLGMLIIFVFGATTMPTKTNAQKYERSHNGTGTGALGGYVISNTNQNYDQIPDSNPSPVIKSISPSSSNVGIGVKTITISGEGFVPGSIARINGSNRSATFIDSSHLLMQITGNDTYAYRSNGGFFITVFNGAPGGGYSNAVFFKINNPAVPSIAASNTQKNYPDNTNYTSTNFTDAIQTENGNEAEQDYSNLASNAIYGSNSFMPSGLIQWIFFAILVLLIVILVRKIYGADKKYHAKPLKHA